MPPPGAGRPRLGFFDGVRALFGGVGFVVGRRAMWGWALVPSLVATALFVAFGAVTVWSGGELAERLLAAHPESTWVAAGTWAMRVLVAIVGIVVSFLLAISLAQPLSGFALDAIARRQALELGGAAWPEQPRIASMLRSMRVAIAALALSLPALAMLMVVTVVFPPASVVTIPLKFLVTGLAVAYDFLDYPLSLRGDGVRGRVAFLRAHFLATLGFGAAAATLLLVPGLGLVLLPFGVAGATRMVVAAGTTPR